MSDELQPVPRETLFQINETLAGLLAVRSDMLASDPPEDTTSIDGELIAYFQKSVAKADAIIPLWRHFETTAATARAEAARLNAYAKDLEGQLDHLKTRVKEVMIQFDKKSIAGTAGRLMLKGNGGSAPLQIQEDMLPEELVKYEGTIYGADWKLVPQKFKERPGVRMKRLPSNTLIRAALAKPCQECGGEGAIPVAVQPEVEDHGPVGCTACGDGIEKGDGKSRVPGARLLERGQHVEVK